MIKPSNIGLFISGILILIGLYLFYKKIFIEKNEDYRTINVILFFSSVIAIHSILHFLAESKYNYNPLENF
jgi:hypothetical protein